MVNNTLTVPPTSNLPRQLTALEGRETEVGQLCRQLLDPTCRLLTLLGPGGIGKTRLAVEAATRLTDDFADGVAFVNLQPLIDPAQLPNLLADALALPLNSTDSVAHQLFRLLANQERLLVLDNFEHLLTGADFVADLLAQAPSVKLLVTSREVLNLQEEWLLPLAGLAFPTELTDAQSLLPYSAMQLFAARVRHLRPHFALADEATAVGRICQLVEGMPLALELAATWTKTLSCAEIAVEIARNLDFLATTLRNTPTRHRSMVAVFQQSWQQLTSQEQTIFARLAVFRGGFERRAATFVALATPATLTLLVDKSLIRLEQNGRFTIHELLRQFAEQQLLAMVDEQASVQARHGAYFTDFLHQRLPDLLGPRQLGALAEIKVELDNIRMAWTWLIAQGDVNGLRKAAPALSQYYQMQSRFQEGVERFSAAEQWLATVTPSPDQKLAWVVILALLGWLYIRTGRLELATTTLEESLALFYALGLPPVPGLGTDPRLPLGILTLVLGEYERAAQLGQEALITAEAHQHSWNAEFALQVLAYAAYVQGDLTLAHEHNMRGLTLAQSRHERWFSAYMFNFLGEIAYARQEYEQALGYLAASYATRQEFHDREGMARALFLQGNVHGQQQQWALAHDSYHQALTLYEQIQDLGGIVNVRNRLAAFAVKTGDQAAIRQQLGEALRLIVAYRLVTPAFPALVTLGQLFLNHHLPARGVELLTLALHHPASEQEAKQNAGRILQEQRPLLTLAPVTPPAEPMPVDELITLVNHLQMELLLPFATTAAPTGAADTEARASEMRHVDQAKLVEPLTRRELEILQLLAAGLSNEQIANQLIVAIGTVKAHTAQIYGKLGVNSRTQAVATARKLGLLTD